MSSVLRFSINDCLNVRLEGSDCSALRWANKITAGMGAPIDGPDDLRIEFRANVRPQGRSLPPINLGPTMNGIWVADHLDRAAWIPFHRLDEETVVVDEDIDSRFFSNWVYHPSVRAALWRKGSGLFRGAGAEVDGRRAVISAWTATGKSRIVFELMSRGHDYLADDWVSLDASGQVGAISSQLDVRDDQRRYVAPENWPGRRSLVRPMLVKAARWAASATRRARNLSTGLEKLAEAGWKASWTKSDLATVFPQTQVASTGHLDLLVVLASPGVQLPSPADVPEVLSACVQGEYGFTEMEAAYRFTHPGRLDEPLFPRFEVNRDFAAEALKDTSIVIVPFEGSFDDVEAVADMIENMCAGMARFDGIEGVA